MTAPKLFTSEYGRATRQSGSKKGRRSRIISRTFKEVSEMLLTDPDVQDALRRRVLLELAGKRSNPIPLVAVLAAASQGERAKAGSERGAVTFAVSIIQGRGVVERVADAPGPPLLEAHAEVAPDTNETPTTNEKEKT